MRIIIIILSLSLVKVSMAQAKAKLISVEEMMTALNQVAQYYEGATTFRFDVYYASYKGHESVTPYEESKGFILKSGTDYKSEIMGIKTVQSDQYMVTVQPDGKQLILNNAQKAVNHGYSQKEIEESLSKATKIEKSVFGNSVTYLIHYKDVSPISYTEMKISSQGYLEKITFYYSQAAEWESEEGEVRSSKPKLEMKYLNFQKNIAVEAKEFDLTQYIDITQNQVKPSDRMKDYELIDVRIKK